MCELLGFSAPEKQDIRAYLRTFYSHSPQHPNGWGLVREHGGALEWLREPTRAIDSPVLAARLNELEPQKLLLAHIRLATVGAIRTENCHPFHGKDASGREWTLMHNGTIYSSSHLIPYYAVQRGNTDSERMFLYFLDEINKALAQAGGVLTPRERFRVIERAAVSIASCNKLNFLIYDGELLYAHKNMEGTLYYLEKDGGLLISTVPLTDEGWQDFPIARVCAFQDGKLLFEGARHNKIYSQQRIGAFPDAGMNI